MFSFLFSSLLSVNKIFFKLVLGAYHLVHVISVNAMPKQSENSVFSHFVALCKAVNRLFVICEILLYEDHISFQSVKAAVLGGIGSIPGAMIGGFAIGLLEAVVTAVGLSVWKDGVVFAVLIVVLLCRPTGILGHKATEKV